MTNNKRCFEKEPIYMDYNATTPVVNSVLKAVEAGLKEFWGNPSCSDELGVSTKEALENARKQVASLIGAHPEEIVFTSGGTESNNCVILGLAQELGSKGNHMITTEIEHPSVLNPFIRLLENGWEVTFLKVDGAGLVDPEEVKKALRKDTVLVSVMMANNEVGTIQPVSQIASIAHGHGALVHTDCAQAVGKIKVDVSELDVDYLTIAGHKLYAPKGIGAFFVKKNAPFGKIFWGAGQEMGRRPGTEPVPLGLGLGAACAYVAKDLEKEAERQKRLRDRLYMRLQTEIDYPILRHGDVEAVLPNTLSISFPGLNGAQILANARNVMASTGAACHDRSLAVSHVLSAMGVSKEVAMGTIRLSLGRFTSEDDIEGVTSSLREAVLQILS